MSEREAPGLLRESCFLLLRLAPSGQGKAGALWGTTFPLLHPLPSPRNTPSFRWSPLVASHSVRLSGKALRNGYPAPRASPRHVFNGQ